MAERHRAPVDRSTEALESEPEGLLVTRLTERAVDAGSVGIVFVARSESRAARLHRAAQALAPSGLTVLLLPGWDCLPYDRASPSPAVMGQRMAVASRLAQRPPAGFGPRLLILSAEAAMQRLPPPDPGAVLELTRGAPFDPDALQRQLGRLGYRFDERVDEPGEAAIHGSILDIFPAWAPGDPIWRVRHEDGRIAGIHRFDALSQRSQEQEEEAILLGPATELVLPEDDPLVDARPPGIEHALPHYRHDLITPLALLPEADVILDEEAEAVREQRGTEISEAFRTRIALRPSRPDAPPLPPPDALYLDDAAWSAALEGRRVTVTRAPPEAAASGTALPRFAESADPEDAFLAYVEDQLDEGRRVALAGGQGRGARRLAARVGIRPRPVDGWPEFRRAPPGSFALFDASPGPVGFGTTDAVVIPYSSIRPDFAVTKGATHNGAAALTEPTLQPDDAVIHVDHGLGALRGVEVVDTGQARLDCLRLDYAADTTLLVPFDELDRIWRYGAEAASVTLDRLDGEAWAKRRREAEAEADRTARRLLDLVREREATTAPVIRPPRDAYERLVARFPYDPTDDQASAIEAALANLRSGRPMDRLVCGDVGFGKTEVALRAAGAVALTGRQVALLAPTTVLVRQHLEIFRRRFAGLPVRVEALSRLTPPAEARAVRAAIAAGEVQIAIGTQALAAKGVRFHDLALLIIDEEQRFGTRQKETLQRLRGRDGLHLMTLTATPIPRTLQTAMVGLRDLSVIATPPARRQPVRTLRAPLDDALLSQALQREARRGGQSFVVCPRIEDIAPMRERLASLLPELMLIEAHGGLPPAEMDEAVVRFASGKGDVLLATNIVEAGLDVPRANTMLVWRADRFGLAQLHQLRGRVGRGRTRGVVYFLTDPVKPLPATAERRLRALEAMDRVGAGFAISARDLDLRGAGDLLGEAQAGHLRLVGIELYRHLLDRALALARGEAPPEAWSPHLAIGVDAYVPPDYLPEEALQVDIHARLARILRAGDAGAVDVLEDELEDRFGPAPEPLCNLLALACLSARCRRLGVERLEAGEKAAAATLRDGSPATAPPPLEPRNGRLILARPSATAAERLAAAEALVAALTKPRRRRTVATGHT